MGAALIAINDNGTYTASIGYLNRSFTIDLPAFTARNESLPRPTTAASCAGQGRADQEANVDSNR